MVSLALALGEPACGQGAVVFSNFDPAAPIVNIDPSTDVPSRFFGFDESHGDGMVGWTFQLLVLFTVTEVGWYDQDGDGLTRAFQVGLWQADPELPPFQRWLGASLIGDPVHGLSIPEGTNAVPVGVWRVVKLPQPLTLQPGFYEFGGLDSEKTADVIKYVGAIPGTRGLTPPSSPISIGDFFYSATSTFLWQTNSNFGPTTGYYLANGLELGPML
ncbi:MAG TPA: hypothetical protein VGR78_00315, partial [Verrucomicrobiae bacterium]|nr:hypothetical protein [Verrucomicrobiae bacterium]